MEEFYYTQHRRKSPGRFLELLVAAVVGGLLVLATLPFILPHLLPEAEPILPWKYKDDTDYEGPDLEYQQTAVVKAVQRVSPAVVGVTRISQSRDFFGRLLPPAPSGYGSGVIISPQGYIITNYHVVENATEVIVSLSTGEELEAEIVGVDPGTDLAVLKIDALPELPWAELGDSDKLTVGEFVVAIGNPGGLELERSVTLGIVSATDRSFDVYDWVFGLIQTDAAINPGNSGGPLVNLRGEVIGINSVKIADAEGLGFSIPSNLVKSITETLIAHGRVIRPMLGVNIREISPSLAEAFGLSSEYGLLVVNAAGPAYQAGIRPDDIIVEVEGQRIVSIRDLRRIMSAKSVGDQVEVKVVRGRNEMTFTVTLTELTPQ